MFQENPLRKTIAAIALLGLFLLIGQHLQLYLPALENKVQQLGYFAPMGFIALFVALTPMFISVDALCFAAGLLFSLAGAEAVIVIGTYTAAAVIFSLGRYVLRAKVQNLIAKHQRFAALQAVMSGANSFKLMLILRLTPLPFAMLSYALSVTSVKFIPYLIATSGILIYNGSLVYLGYSTKHLSGLMQGKTAPEMLPLPLLFAGLVLAVGVLIYVAKKAEQSLAQEKK